MRHPRLSPGRLPPLVAVAHGSRDPRAAATISELLALVRSRAAAGELAGLDVRAAFLGHAAPSPRQALSAVAESDGACVVVPLLLTAAYHSKTDIPAQIAAATAAVARLDVRCADPLGPHPLLLAALDRRLAEAAPASGADVAGADVAGADVGGADVGGADVGGADVGGAARSSTSVVLAAAGSSDQAANATITAIAARWQAARGWRRVVPAYASAIGPRPDEAVRALLAAEPGTPVVVATYLLAPGHFADNVRETALAAGAAAVSPALGAAAEVADLVLDRYAAAAHPVQASPQMQCHVMHLG